MGYKAEAVNRGDNIIVNAVVVWYAYCNIIIIIFLLLLLSES